MKIQSEDRTQEFGVLNKKFLSFKNNYVLKNSKGEPRSAAGSGV